MLYEQIKDRLVARPRQLEELTDWLFVVLNTAKAMIVSVDQAQYQNVDAFLECQSVQEIQLLFDFCQGQFGKASFSHRKSSVYLYLCSLVALFPNQAIGEEAQQYMKRVLAVTSYLLYDL